MSKIEAAPRDTDAALDASLARVAAELVVIAAALERLEAQVAVIASAAAAK